MANNLPTIKPSLNLQFANTNAIPPDVTFTRASTSGGYYDGRTVSKAEENLILQSQTFDSASWTKGNVTVTANAAAAPDGTTTADKIAETAATGTHNVSQAVTLLAVAYTRSVFLKAAERTFALISDGTNHAVSVDLTTGAATLAAGSPTSIASVESPAGSGWWRVSWTYTAAAGSQALNIYSSADGVWANRSFAGVDGSGILVWGDQVEQRSSVTAYTPTTTQQITNYVPKLLFAPAGVPVFDHNPTTGAALGLSVWEARTNLLLYSQEFDNAYWTKSNVTISTNQIIAPDGTLTADKLVEDATLNQHRVLRAIDGSTKNISIYAKAAERSYIGLFAAVGTRTYFNLSAGTIGTVSSGSTATIESVGNGWYRCTLYNAHPTNAGLFQLSPDGTTETYTGDGYSGVLIWGAQLEAGAFATPYIPTVASTVARSADVAVMTGVNFTRWFNNAQGCLVIDAVSVNAGSSTATITALGSADANNRILVISRTSGVTGSFASATANGSTQAELNGTHAASNKVAVSYAVNDYKGCLNGGAVSTDTTALVPVLNTLTIGATVGTVFSGYYKSIQYYPIALTSAQLKAVTA